MVRTSHRQGRLDIDMASMYVHILYCTYNVYCQTYSQSSTVLSLFISLKHKSPELLGHVQQ